jgi:predicted lipoprotein with Yx(FWY)xxD motif
MSTRILIASGAALLALLTACSSKGTGGGGSSQPAGAGAQSVVISSTGSTLVNASGLTLYANTVDTASKITCTGQCTSTWPPVTGSPKAGAGVDASKLGTAKRPDGTTQVTFDGHPLYLFTKDTAAGDMKGEGVADQGGTWHVATQSGIPGASSAPSSTPGSAPATGGSKTGYNY